MAPKPTPFPHLELVLRERGPAYLTGSGTTAPATIANKADRLGHSGRLGAARGAISSAWRASRQQRDLQGLPPIDAGIPLLLRIDPGLELDDLRELFQFEIVSEHEDGFVIVASEDMDLQAFATKVNEFASSVWGSARVASVHEMFEDADSSLRLKRLLSEELFARWATLKDDEVLICDVGVSCLGTKEIPKKPTRRKKETEQEWANRDADWADGRRDAYARWDLLKSEREEAVERIVRAYNGQILLIVDGATSEAAELPDSFTVRVEINGKGLRDLVLNYPYLFEVVEAEAIETLRTPITPVSPDPQSAMVVAPDEDAPRVCIVDSGIQEGHRLLAAAIDAAASRCFLPGSKPTDVADHVAAGGHGTRVAGAVLFPVQVPTTGEFKAPTWLRNARVLDKDNRIPKRVFPPLLLRTVVNHHVGLQPPTRIFNHSINSSAACRLLHMSAWASEIDVLSDRNDVLIIQSAGNIPDRGNAPWIGVADHLDAGRVHPAYLNEKSCRVSDPAQSLQALTVGSVASGIFSSGSWKSVAQREGHPSAFSRSGPGIWGVLKPEVVEYGGDLCRSGDQLGTPDVTRDAYPELVRSTLHSPAPAFDRDAVGTSYAAPKVTSIAAQLQAVLPDEPCLLYRALIVQSARWPSWTRTLKEPERSDLIRWIGFGVPDGERASTNTDHRITLITNGPCSAKAKDCHLYQIPIPEAMRRPGEDYEVLVEVSLSYSAQPRRTRRNLRRYLSVWLDWKASNLGESLDAFRARALKEVEGDDDAASGSTFPWMIGPIRDGGQVRGTRRNSGTIQKDWAYVRSNQLPKDFCVAIMGHEGWSKDPDAEATYALAVTFEIVGREIPIYQEVRVAVDELRAQVELEAELEAEVEVEVE